MLKKEPTVQSQNRRLQWWWIGKTKLDNIILWSCQQLLGSVVVIVFGLLAAIFLLFARQCFLLFLFSRLLRLAVRLQIFDAFLLLFEFFDLLATLLHEHFLEHGIVAFVVVQFFII